MSLRRAVVVSIAVAVLAAAGYTAYWFHVAGELRKQIDAWADTRRAVGWQVEWTSLAVGGFPASLRADMAAPHLRTPAGLDWSTGALTAVASPFDLTLITVAAPGDHHLRWGDGPPVAARAADATARIDLTPAGRLDDTSLTVNGLTVTGLTGAAEGAEPLTAAALALSLDPAAPPPAGHDDVLAAFSLAVQDVGLPPIPGLVLDRDIALVEVSGRVMGPIPPGSPAEALAAWGAEGGTVELDHLAVDWPPMGLEADGTLALDASLQPLVALSARVRGYGELMDRLARARVVDPGAAAAAKMVLSLLAKPDARGRPAIPLPVTVQDGALYLGPAKVGTVPAIQWPGGDNPTDGAHILR